jgi:hypothetical protein
MAQKFTVKVRRGLAWVATVAEQEVEKTTFDRAASKHDVEAAIMWLNEKKVTPLSTARD